MTKRASMLIVATVIMLSAVSCLNGCGGGGGGGDSKQKSLFFNR